MYLRLYFMLIEKKRSYEMTLSRLHIKHGSLEICGMCFSFPSLRI